MLGLLDSVRGFIWGGSLVLWILLRGGRKQAATRTLGDDACGAPLCAGWNAQDTRGGAVRGKKALRVVGSVWALTIRTFEDAGGGVGIVRCTFFGVSGLGVRGPTEATQDGPCTAADRVKAAATLALVDVAGKRGYQREGDLKKRQLRRRTFPVGN